MRVLFFAVFLSIMQATPPVPRQTTDSANQAPQKVEKGTAQHKDPVTPTPPPKKVIQEAPRKEAPANNPTSPNAEQALRVRELPPVSVPKDWMDKTTWVFAAILVVVGILGVCAAVRTLKTIEEQTRHIARQALSMRRQTTHLRNSVIQARKGARAARISADAAKASADAAIASERAWVMVDLDKVPGVGFLGHGASLEAGETRHDANVRVRCICSNQGKTPAKILEKRAALILVSPNNPLPPIPNLDIEIEDPVPHYLQPGGEHKSDWRLDTQVSISAGGGDIVTFFVVYGIVKYRHLFSEQIVHTMFGYRIRVDSVLERLIDYPKYNENT